MKKVNVFQVNFYLEAPSIHMSVLQSKIHFGFLTRRTVSFVRLFKYQIITTFVLFLFVPNSKVSLSCKIRACECSFVLIVQH